VSFTTGCRHEFAQALPVFQT